VIELGATPRVGAERRARLDRLIAATRKSPPSNLASVIRDELRVDLTTAYAGRVIPHPFGKASGQLSHTISQVVEDARAELAFVVLKTVIAESADGQRTMGQWSNPETKMHVEERASRSGRSGWTVSWKGRGWAGSLDDYIRFMEGALAVGAEHDLLVVPSVKYHLPELGSEPRREEYRHTTKLLNDAWLAHARGPLILEKDLSPTLAGDEMAMNRSRVTYWLSYLTEWILGAVPDVTIGIKVMNAVFDDAFQIEMVRTLAECKHPPAFLVVFNRLFDQDRKIAYGGWDLSDRNLAVLDAINDATMLRLPLSATGNICSGRMMVEYALRGCQNGQVHTFFQIPRKHYLASGASRSLCALYTLLLDPADGLIPWMWTLHDAGVLAERGGELRFRDLVGCALR